MIQSYAWTQNAHRKKNGRTKKQTMRQYETQNNETKNMTNQERREKKLHETNVNGNVKENQISMSIVQIYRFVHSFFLVLLQLLFREYHCLHFTLYTCAVCISHFPSIILILQFQHTRYTWKIILPNRIDTQKNVKAIDGGVSCVYEIVIERAVVTSSPRSLCASFKLRNNQTVAVSTTPI